MKITERRLRLIIRETLLEEQNRIDESAKDALTKGLLALMMTYGASAVVAGAKSIGSSSSQKSSVTQQDTHMYKGLKGEKLIDYILENGEEIPEGDLNDAAIALSEYDRPEHSSVGSGRRLRHDKAIDIIKSRLEDLSVPQSDQMYGVGEKFRGRR